MAVVTSAVAGWWMVAACAGEGGGLHLYRWDGGTGGLERVAVAPGLGAAGFVAAHPKGRVVYAVFDEGGAREPSGRVQAFRLVAGGGMEAMNRKSTSGSSACHVSVSPDGTKLMVANYRGIRGEAGSQGSVDVFALEPDGSIGARLFEGRHEGSGPHPQRQTVSHPHSMTPHPGGRWAVAPDLGVDRVEIYRIDGKVERAGSIPVPAGSGPRHAAFADGGRLLFVIMELSNRMHAYRFDAERGTAEALADASTLPPGHAGGGACAEVRVLERAGLVFGSNRGHESIVAFDYDAGTGAMRAPVWTGGATGPRGFVLSPEGRWLVAGSTSDNVMRVFAVNEKTGGLELRDTVGAPSPQAFEFVVAF